MGPSFSLTFILCVILFSWSSTSSSVDRISQFDSIADGETLVSNGGSFEFGFFSPRNKSKSRYAGIWYSKVPAPMIAVWVANRCNPINDSSAGSLSLDSSGNAVLLYNNATVMWLTNTSRRAEKPVLQLLDSGNLVLRDDRDGTVLWESFDHPSDTVLPGMKLGWDFGAGINRRVTSWKSRDDPCGGGSSYGFETNSNGSPEIYHRKQGSKVYRPGPWNGVRFSGVPTDDNAFYGYRYLFDDREVYFTFSVKFEGKFFVRVVVNETALSWRFVWVDEKLAWRSSDWTNKADCDKYGFCGPNGICAMAGQNPTCTCLTRGFTERDSRNRTSGCVRRTALNCEGSKRDGFVKLTGLKLPDTAYSWVDRSMSLKECRAKCLNNCSCTAYSNSDIRGQGSGCFMWFGDLVDIQRFPVNGQDLHVRVSASELENVNSKHKSLIIAALVVVAFVMILFGLWIIRRKFMQEIRQENDQEGLELPLFDLATICSATDNFSNQNKLGEGGFGPVYKGALKDGREIAVKRLSKCSGQGISEFMNEVILIAKLQHRNLVRLLGCCIQGDEKMLIYEFMPNKSLDLFLFAEAKKKVLDWHKRFEIICGIARGILYLHQDSRLRIIHRDLKASNVLLDSEMTPKISDFGMARSFGENQTEGNTNRVVGTFGYMSPEYAGDGLFSVKSDVFSFGVLVLEIISGRKNRGFFNPDRDLNLTGHAWRLWKDENAVAIVDEYLINSSSMSQIMRCVHISLLCVQQTPDDRPNMSSVVMMLGSQTPLDQPKEPGFFVVRAFDDHIGMSSSSSNQVPSINEVTISASQPR